MAKRQKRISSDQLTSAVLNDLINTWCTLVKNDNSVNFVKIISFNEKLVNVYSASRKYPVNKGAIREIIIDSHA